MSHRVRCFSRYALILIWLSCSFNVKMLTLLAMLMIIFPSPVHNTYHPQFASFKTIAKRNLIGKNNYIKRSYEKSKVILSSNTRRVIRFDNVSITSSLSVKLLGTTFDSDLKFEEQVNKICNIVHKKLNALHRIASYISLEKWKRLLTLIRLGFLKVVFWEVSSRTNLISL